MGQGDVYIHNAPALPKNPMFKGSTKEERRAFMASYNQYISQTNALTANGVRPFLMPLSACIEPATKQRVAEWDMGKFPEEVTDTEWATWFTMGFQVDPRTLDSLKKRVKASAVKLVSLHRAVTEQMALTRNKPLKKDVYRFVRWLREFAIGHERFVGYEEETKPAGKPDPPRMPQGSGQTFRPASAQAPPRAAPAPFTPQAPTSSTPGLKCKSTTHKVRECPGITDDEAVRLLKEHGRMLGQKRSDWSRGDGRADAGRGRGTPGGRVETMRTNAVKVGREDLTATVDGVVPVRASLLDSGADLSVASGGLVSALL
ncbi:hypothetical protein DYB26_007520, partial [Aphanomyces astaci]